MTLEPEPNAPIAAGRNPILAAQKEHAEPAVDLTHLDAPNILATSARRKSTRRELVDQRRIESAAEALTQFGPDVELYGFTKGQFSIIDLLNAALDFTGPAHLDVSTWTVGNADMSTVLDFIDGGRILSSRWLVDISFQRRQPELAARLRSAFGVDAIRIALSHAKFYLLGNADWRIVIHTSMNLNFNRRFENFTIAHDPESYDFHQAILAEIWARKKARITDKPPAKKHRTRSGTR